MPAKGLELRKSRLPACLDGLDCVTAYDRGTQVAHARQPDNLATLAFAGVIAESLRTARLPLIQAMRGV